MKLMPKGVSRFVGRRVLVTKKNSPHIFFALGIVGVVGGAVLACRATLKLEETLDDVKKDFDNIKKPLGTSTDMTYEDARIVGRVYFDTAVRFGKLYGPAIVVGGLGVASLSGSHVQLSRRNAALSATLASVMKAFDGYRDRVRRELGEKLERDIYRGTDDIDVAAEEYQAQVSECGGYGFSPYARLFDESCVDFRKDSELNRFFIQCQQNYANQLLQSRGHVFLNEIYDRLGFDRTRAGQIVGWVRDGDGDGYIDFGMDVDGTQFMNGFDPRVWLDFNVDGVVFDRI